MNPQPDQDLESRLQNLEIELNSSPQPPTVSQPQKPLQPQTDNSQPVQLQLQLINWFNGLSGFRKLMVVGVTAIVALALLRALLKLFFAVISLAVLVVLLYFGYQFFLARSFKNK
jgi:hypothetical protein